jgi:hypothetical protein
MTNLELPRIGICVIIALQSAVERLNLDDCVLESGLDVVSGSYRLAFNQSTEHRLNDVVILLINLHVRNSNVSKSSVRGDYIKSLQQFELAVQLVREHRALCLAKSHLVKEPAYILSISVIQTSAKLFDDLLPQHVLCYGLLSGELYVLLRALLFYALSEVLRELFVFEKSAVAVTTFNHSYLLQGI